MIDIVARFHELVGDRVSVDEFMQNLTETYDLVSSSKRYRIEWFEKTGNSHLLSNGMLFKKSELGDIEKSLSDSIRDKIQSQFSNADKNIIYKSVRRSSVVGLSELLSRGNIDEYGLSEPVIHHLSFTYCRGDNSDSEQIKTMFDYIVVETD